MKDTHAVLQHDCVPDHPGIMDELNAKGIDELDDLVGL